VKTPGVRSSDCWGGRYQPDVVPSGSAFSWWNGRRLRCGLHAVPGGERTHMCPVRWLVTSMWDCGGCGVLQGGGEFCRLRGPRHRPLRGWVVCGLPSSAFVGTRFVRDFGPPDGIQGRLGKEVWLSVGTKLLAGFASV